MLKIYNFYLPVLKRIYDKYCQRAKNGIDKESHLLEESLAKRRNSTIKASGIVLTTSNAIFDKDTDTTISFDEFRMLMAESHIIDDRVNLRVLKTLFMQSMQFSYSIKQSENDTIRTSTQQCFIEFLEAIARVCIAKYGDNGLSGHLEQNLKKLIKNHLEQIDPFKLLKKKSKKKK